MTLRITGAVLVGIAVATPGVTAQGFRLTGTTTVDYEQLQPMALDSVPLSATTTDTGLLRQTANGTIVECVGVDQYCSYYKSTTPLSTVPILQDFTLTGWGLGEGISVYADAEIRTAVGSAPNVLPLADQHFDLIAAYAELDRSIVRARLGRQWVSSPLGYYAYDGASVFVAPLQGFTVQAYGGWGLAQALTYERTNPVISSVESLAPTDPGYIIGATIDYHPPGFGGVSLQYQREIETNFDGLYSERIAGAGDARLGPTLLNAQVTYDLATGDFNNALLRAQLPLGTQWTFIGQVRHYVPFFELWTIWGAFSPVGYNEGSLSAAWATTDQRIHIAASGDYREYENTDAELSFLPLRSNGFDVGLDGSWRLTSVWSVLGGYHLLIGVGASRSDGDAGLRWRVGSHGSLGLTGSAFQSIDEFTVGSGLVLGLAANGAYEIMDALHLEANFGAYRHVGTDTPQIANWNQLRGSLQLTWLVGRDPGIARLHQ